MSTAPLAKILIALSFFACTSVFATPLIVGVAGVESVDAYGAPGNTVLLFDVGANAAIISLAYDVNLTAFGTSWLSEMDVAFTDTGGNGVQLVPLAGAAYQHAGTASAAGSVSLDDIGLTFAVGSDGILRVQFFESFNDVVGPDGQWNFGTITVGVEQAPGTGVPEPSSVLLTGAGLAVLAYVGRRLPRLSKNITEHILNG